MPSPLVDLDMGGEENDGLPVALTLRVRGEVDTVVRELAVGGREEVVAVARELDPLVVEETARSWRAGEA